MARTELTFQITQVPWCWIVTRGYEIRDIRMEGPKQWQIAGICMSKRDALALASRLGPDWYAMEWTIGHPEPRDDHSADEASLSGVRIDDPAAEVPGAEVRGVPSGGEETEEPAP